MIFIWCESKETLHDKQYDIKEDHTQRVNEIDHVMVWLWTLTLSVGIPLEDLGANMIGVEFHKFIQYTGFSEVNFRFIVLFELL